MRVAVVREVERALELLEAQPAGASPEPAVILRLDLAAAEIDGRAVLHRVWNDASLWHIPVVMCTSWSNADVILARYDVRAVLSLQGRLEVDQLLEAARRRPAVRLLIAVVPEAVSERCAAADAELGELCWTAAPVAT